MINKQVVSNTASPLKHTRYTRKQNASKPQLAPPKHTMHQCGDSCMHSAQLMQIAGGKKHHKESTGYISVDARVLTRKARKAGRTEGQE